MCLCAHVSVYVCMHRHRHVCMCVCVYIAHVMYVFVDGCCRSFLSFFLTLLSLYPSFFHSVLIFRPSCPFRLSILTPFLLFFYSFMSCPVLPSFLPSFFPPFVLSRPSLFPVLPAPFFSLPFPFFFHRRPRG